jgi:hypothetical protein
LRARFGVLLALSAVSVFLVACPLFPWSSIAGLLLAAVPFLLSRPLRRHRVLFRRAALDEDEQARLSRTDGIAITVFFTAYLLWLVVGLVGSRLADIHIGDFLLGWVVVALQTLPVFVLIHSLVGIIVFSRR